MVPVFRSFSPRFEFLIIIAAVFILPSLLVAAYGHGLFGETLPPVPIQNRNVTFSINTVLTPGPPAKADKVVTIQLYETNTKNPIKDVTFFVRAIKDGKVLFEHEFQRDTGNLVMAISTTESGDVSIWEQDRILTRMFGAFMGSNADSALIKGPIFDSGGLYKFHVEINTADSYMTKLNPPVKYDAAISIPDSTSYEVDDKNYGKQKINIITYYDQISNFQYLPETKSIKFWMPFDWSDVNINQVSVAHEEIRIPRSFGDLLVTKYTSDVNDLPVPNSAVTVDDYSTDDRIVHIVLNKPELQDLSKIKENTKQGMEFTLKPSAESGFPLTVLTRNGQYKVSLSWDPVTLLSDSKTKFSFDFRDAYLITNKTIPVSYDFSVLQNDKVILSHSGTAGQSGLAEDTIDALIPDDVSGPIRIKFENLGGNRYADAEFLSVVVPEFPVGLLPVLFVALVATLALVRLKMGVRS